ncbi:MAG: sugar phosphate isomerase/epimerase [bacterium]|nr:sugar phosphate isomerase/epimerase [bacterium]
MEDKIAIVVSNANEGVSVYETIDAIKEAGFKNVFIQWYNRNWNPTQEEQLKYIKEKGLNIIFAHLGYSNINSIWLDSNIGDDVIESYKNDINILVENGINLFVMHLSRTFNPPIYNEIGLKRIKELVNYAKEKNAKIAFENVETKGYIEYVFDNIDSDNIGLCFDSGHFHTFYKDKFDMSKFNNKILAVHLHDNFQTGDFHLIPFDGSNDWNKIINILNSNNYNGYITMEQCYRNNYLDISINEFYKKSFEIGKKLLDMKEK